MNEPVETTYYALPSLAVRYVEDDKGRDRVNVVTDYGEDVTTPVLAGSAAALVYERIVASYNACRGLSLTTLRTGVHTTRRSDLLAALLEALARFVKAQSSILRSPTPSRVRYEIAQKMEQEADSMLNLVKHADLLGTIAGDLLSGAAGDTEQASSVQEEEMTNDEQG